MLEEPEADRLIKLWLKACAEHAGYSVVGMPTVKKIAGSQSGAFGQLPVKYEVTISVREESEAASKVEEAMREIPATGGRELRGRKDDVVTLRFRIEADN